MHLLAINIGIIWSIVKIILQIVSSVILLGLYMPEYSIYLLLLAAPGFSAILLFILAKTQPKNRVLMTIIAYYQFFQIFINFFVFLFMTLYLLKSDSDNFLYIFRGLLLVNLIIDSYIGYKAYIARRES